MYTKRAGRHRKLSRLSRGGGVDSPELFPDNVDLPFVAGDALADAGEELAQFGGLGGELVQALVGSDRALVDVSVLIVVQIQVLPTGTRITRNGIEAPSVTGFRCRFALAVIKKRPDEDADGNRPVERETYDCLAHGQAPYGSGDARRSVQGSTATATAARSRPTPMASTVTGQGSLPVPAAMGAATNAPLATPARMSASRERFASLTVSPINREAVLAPWAAKQDSGQWYSRYG